jgi:hypothetical protein
MLTPDERRTVIEVLQAQLIGVGDQRAFLADVVFVQYRAIFPGPYLDAHGPDAWAKAAVQACLNARWVPDPSLMEVMLDHLVTTGAGSLAPVLQRVRQKVDPNPSPANTQWTYQNRPFFDRRGLRDAVQHVIGVNEAPVLVIRAPGGAWGRSWTLTLVDHLVHALGDGTRTARAILSRGSGPAYTVPDLGRSLLSSSGLGELPPADGTAAYTTTMLQTILGRMQERGTPWVLALDGFDQPDLNDDVVEAVGILGDLIANQGFRDSVRLVLAGWTGPLPNVAGSDVVYEDLGPASAVSAADLEPALLAIAQVRAAAGKFAPPPQDLPRIAAAMLAGVPADGKERLSGLHAALADFWRGPEMAGGNP